VNPSPREGGEGLLLSIDSEGNAEEAPMTPLPSSASPSRRKRMYVCSILRARSFPGRAGFDLSCATLYASTRVRDCSDNAVCGVMHAHSFQQAPYSMSWPLPVDHFASPDISVPTIHIITANEQFIASMCIGKEDSMYAHVFCIANQRCVNVMTV
jgi:hypothetical protein